MIAPTTATLEDAVAELVAAGSGVDYNSVLSGNKGTPVLDELFASLVLIHQAIEGIPATVMSLASDEADLDALTIATVRGRYSVQWFRTGAHDAAKRLSVWVWSPEGVAQAQQADLTVLRVSDVRQLDDVVSGAWEERAGLDIEVGYTQKIDQTVGRLKAAPIEVGTGGSTETITVEV